MRDILEEAFENELDSTRKRNKKLRERIFKQLNRKEKITAYCSLRDLKGLKKDKLAKIKRILNIPPDFPDQNDEINNI